MPDSETFDAFYARTVWNVTSQIRALAGNDGTADHAIREAYAKAYQQWYQVSGYRDPEGWVLATATDAYERRSAEAVGLSRDYATRGTDSGTWPGIYRPVAEPGPIGGQHNGGQSGIGEHGAGQGEPLADPDATVAPSWRPSPEVGGSPGGAGATGLGPDGPGPDGPGPDGPGPDGPGPDGLRSDGLGSGQRPRAPGRSGLGGRPNQPGGPGRLTQHRPARVAPEPDHRRGRSGRGGDRRHRLRFGRQP